MIIFLDDSLIEALFRNDWRAVSALTIVGQQAREGSHVLLGSRAFFAGLEDVRDRLDARTAAILRRSGEKLTQRKGLQSASLRAIRLVSDASLTAPIRRREGIKHEILLPASSVDANSSLVLRPLLMVENLNDAVLYLKIAHDVLRSGTLGDLSWLADVPLRCEIVPGGGHTIAQLFAFHKQQADRIGLAIVDGDYRYPMSNPGLTAQALLDEVRRLPTSDLLEAEILEARTIENCIPRAAIIEILTALDKEQGHRAHQLVENLGNSPFWRLFPVKKGVRCHELGGGGQESIFWTSLFGNRRCDVEDTCASKTACKKYAMPPVSDQLLALAAAAGAPLQITAECGHQMIDLWRRLILLLYSYFCGAERALII